MCFYDQVSMKYFAEPSFSKKVPFLLIYTKTPKNPKNGKKGGVGGGSGGGPKNPKKGLLSDPSTLRSAFIDRAKKGGGGV